jgi:hypothetical protein
MARRIKVFTHEVIVHSQVTNLEKILERRIDYEITLNTKGARSNIQFEVSETEVDLIKSKFGYAIMTQD